MQQDKVNACLLNDKPTTYFELIEKVGSKGRYQKYLFVLLFLMWLVTSLLIMGTSFIFWSPKFNCDSIGVSSKDCEDYVCSLPESQRSKFYQKIDIVSLATQFGPYHCDRVLELSALRMTFFIGVFFGYLFVFYFTDNFGRKYSMVLAWSITLFGLIMLGFALNIQMACCGLFFAGFGSETCIRISMTLIGETTQNLLRQKYSIALQISFGMGSIVTGLSYYLIGDWRVITITLCLIPCAILLILTILYIEETPKFLIEKNIDKAIKSLNRIANLVTIKEVQNVAKCDTKSNSKRSLIDVCRFKSVRNNFIFSSIFLFCINFLYLGPSIIISELPLSIFASQIILGATQSISYPFCFFFIERLPRRKSGFALIGTPLVIFIILVFVQPEQNCDMCLESIIQLILVFAARFGICAYFAVFFLYITELFPLPLRGIGFGMSSLFGSLGAILSQFILSSISSTKLNPMIIFGLVSATGCGAIYFLPQTLNKKLDQRIDQEKQPNSSSDSDSLQDIKEQVKNPKQSGN